MRRHTRPRTLSIGTISSGTLRPEDLIPAYISALEDLRLRKADRLTLNKARRAFEANSTENEDVEDEPAFFGELVDELAKLAESYAPDYCYVGSTEGDGAEIGCWPMIPDAFDEDVYRSADGPGEPETPIKGYERAGWRHHYAGQSAATSRSSRHGGRSCRRDWTN